MARNENGVILSRLDVVQDVQDVVNNVFQIIPSVTVDLIYLSPSRLMNIAVSHHIRTAQMIGAGMFSAVKERNCPCQVSVKIKPGVWDATTPTKTVKLLVLPLITPAHRRVSLCSMTCAEGWIGVDQTCKCAAPNWDVSHMKLLKKISSTLVWHLIIIIVFKEKLKTMVSMTLLTGRMRKVLCHQRGQVMTST